MRRAPLPARAAGARRSPPPIQGRTRRSRRDLRVSDIILALLGLSLLGALCLAAAITLLGRALAP